VRRDALRRGVRIEDVTVVRLQLQLQKKSLALWLRLSISSLKIAIAYLLDAAKRRAAYVFKD
jgi:hypothetical protein